MFEAHQSDSLKSDGEFTIPQKLYRIGEIVRHTPYSRQTIHNYTIMGLIRESSWTQGGHRLYDESVFDKIKSLSPSARGELEVTDLNNMYVKEGTLRCELIDWWIDAGTSHDELLRANNLVAEKVKAGEL